MINKINTLFMRICIFVCLFFPVSALAEQVCNPFQKFQDEGSGNNFLLLGAFRIIKDTFSELATKSWGAFSLPLQAVVAIGLSIYIAVYTLKNVASFSQQDVSAYLSGKGGVIPLMFKGAVIIALLNHQDFVYKYLVSPIIEIGSEISGNSPFGDFESVASVGVLFDKVIDQAQEFNDRAYTLVAMGRLMLCLSTLPKLLFDWYWKLLPFGVTLYIFGWMIVIGISFYMLDILFRLGVGCILLPMAIACGLSRFTSNYTKKTWNLFVNIAFNFVMLGVVIKFTIAMIMMAIEAATKDHLQAFIIEKASQSLNDADTEQIVEALNIYGFIVLTLSCLLAFKLFTSVEAIADKISESSSVGSLGKKMGGDMVKKAKGIAGAPISAAKGFTSAAVKEAAESLEDTGPVNWARGKWQGAKNSVKRAFNVRDID